MDTFTQFANESLHYFCCTLLSGGNRILKDNCSMQPPILFYLQIEDYFLFTTDFLSLQIFVIGRLFSVLVSVGKSFLWCSVLKTDRLKMFTTWYKKAGWSSFFPVHTFRWWMSRGGGGGEGWCLRFPSRSFLWTVYRSLCLYEDFLSFPRNCW